MRERAQLSACPTCGRRRHTNESRRNRPCTDCAETKPKADTDTYEARWPVLDETATTNQICREAWAELPDMVDAAHLVIRGEPTWRLEDHGGQLWLIAKVPVRPVTYRVRHEKDRSLKAAS